MAKRAKAKGRKTLRRVPGIVHLQAVKIIKLSHLVLPALPGDSCHDEGHQLIAIANEQEGQTTTKNRPETSDDQTLQTKIAPTAV